MRVFGLGRMADFCQALQKVLDASGAYSESIHIDIS